MTITVPRPKLNWRERLYLPAIVAGLAITFKHFKNLLLGRTKITMQYPEQKWDGNLPDYYRGAPALVRDEDGVIGGAIFEAAGADQARIGANVAEPEAAGIEQMRAQVRDDAATLVAPLGIAD